VLADSSDRANRKLLLFPKSRREPTGPFWHVGHYLGASGVYDQMKVVDGNF